MDVVFVGTASCTPGTTRGMSCKALRLNLRRKADEGGGNGVEDDGGGGGGAGAAGTWLFDCGQSTQLAMQRTPSMRPGRISLILFTHCHGDHSFGLPGLLCLMGTDRTRDDLPSRYTDRRFMSTKVLKAFQPCISKSCSE
jgi:ribonuclease Z